MKRLSPLAPSAADKIEALQLVRMDIQSGRQAWICWALHNVARYNKKLELAAQELERYVTKQLEQGNPNPVNEPRPTLGFWVRDCRPDLPNDEDTLREYRLQWIDWMIACLEGKDPTPKG